MHQAFRDGLRFGARYCNRDTEEERLMQLCGASVRERFAEKRPTFGGYTANPVDHDDYVRTIRVPMMIAEWHKANAMRAEYV